MRSSTIALVALSLALSAGPVFAAPSPMAACSAQWQAMKKAGTTTGTYKDFSKTCLSKSGSAAQPAAAQPAAAAPAKKPSILSAMMAKKPAATTAAPAAAPASAAAPAAAAPKTKSAMSAKAPKVADTDPTGATAQCKDGTYSHSKTHSGSCAGHKGVAKFL